MEIADRTVPPAADAPPDADAPPGADAPIDADVPDSPLPDRPDGRRTGWAGWLRRGLLVVVLGFAVWAIVRNRTSLVAALADLSPWAVLGSFVAALLAMVASLFMWRAVLADLGAPLSVKDGARVFYLSQLGKYVPGGIWSIASQVALTRELRVPRRTSLAGGVLTIAVSTGVGLIVAGAMLPFAAPEAARKYWWIMLAIPVFLVALHPPVLGWLINRALRVIGRPPLPRAPTRAGLLRAAAWQLVVWLMLGVHAWLLVVGVGGPVGRSLPVAIAGYALAYSIGLLALMPAGAGIRDLALIIAFGTVIPGPAALAVALVSRTLLVVVDLLMAGIQRLVRRKP
ncbi:MAG TPA: lysylphosphatidylglycerol synthase domain-containing protein [Cryptosporangiaceae bacterium]|nr:lysylphosphatidylglycerol synthase domain-containing protein [Cryptosporangiaceae bacterium]